MAAEKILVEVQVEGDINESGGAFQDLSQSADKATKSVEGTTKSVHESGGAMGILNMVTGGYAQVAKDAFEATTDLKIGLKLAKLQATLFGNAMKTAVTATGIGALVVAVGLLVTYWDDIMLAVTGTNSELEEQLLIQEKVSEAALAEFETLERTDNILKLKGASELDILNIKINALKIAIEEEKLSVKSRKESLKESFAADNRIANFLTQVPLGGLLSKAIYGDLGERAIARIEGEKDIDDGLEGLLNKMAGFELSRNKIEADGREQRKKERDEFNAAQLEIEDEDEELFYEAINDRFEVTRGITAEQDQIKLEDQAALDAELAAMSEKQLAEYTEAEKKKSKATKKALDERNGWEKMAAEEKIALALGSASQVASALEHFAGENEKAAKAFAITSVVIDTALAIMKGYGQLGPIGGTIAAVGMAAIGVASISKITSSSTSSSVSAPSTDPTLGGEGVLSDTPPPTFGAGSTGNDQIGTDIANALGNQTVKAYVVSTEMTNQQQLDRETSNLTTL